MRALCACDLGLFTASRDKSIKLWTEGADGQLSVAVTFVGHTSYVTALAYIPSGAAPQWPKGALVSGAVAVVLNTRLLACQRPAGSGSACSCRCCAPAQAPHRPKGALVCGTVAVAQFMPLDTLPEAKAVLPERHCLHVSKVSRGGCATYPRRGPASLGRTVMENLRQLAGRLAFKADSAHLVSTSQAERG